MSLLDPLDRELLDFLCSCAHHRVRVIRIKAPRAASLRRLRELGHVGQDDYLPSGPALIVWIERQRTRSEAVGARPAVEEPPAPKAAEARGGGDARKVAPPPKPKIKRNTKEAPGTARKASGATSSGAAKRITDHASKDEPAPTVAPLARAHSPEAKVDLKVNARRDPTRPPDAPVMSLADRRHANGMRRVAQVNRGIEQKATERLDAGEKGRNSVESAKMAEIERRRAEEARFLDPIEQAKTVIRIAGWRCWAAPITGGPHGHYIVGNRTVTEAELLAHAERLRTTRARRPG